METKPKRRGRPMHPIVQEHIASRNGKMRVRRRITPNPKNPDTLLTAKQEIIANTYATEVLKRPHGAITRTAKLVGSSAVTVLDTLQKPAVENVVNQHLNAVLHDEDITRERIIEELGCVAFSSMDDVKDEHGNLLPLHLWPSHALRGVQIELRKDAEGNEEVVVKQGLTSKTQALEILGRIKIPELRRAEFSGPDGAPLTAPPIVNINFTKSNGDGGAKVV